MVLDFDYDVIYFMDEQGEYTFTRAQGVTAVSGGPIRQSVMEKMESSPISLPQRRSGLYGMACSVDEGRNIVKGWTAPWIGVRVRSLQPSRSM